MRQLAKMLRPAAAAIAVTVSFAGLQGLSHPSASLAAPALTGTKLTMTSPKYSGFTRDGRHRFDVSAASAVQTIEGADGIELDQPRARLELANGTTLDVSAAIGRLSRDMGSLAMRNDVMLAAATPREIRLGEATVDLRDNTLVSETPFEIASKTGTIRGNRLEVTATGAIVVVNGALVRPGNVVYFDRYALP